MRVIETNVISLFDDNEPQKWVDVHTNTVMGLPQTVRGRIAYALDALTSMRGASWVNTAVVLSLRYYILITRLEDLWSSMELLLISYSTSHCQSAPSTCIHLA